MGTFLHAVEVFLYRTTIPGVTVSKESHDYSYVKCNPIVMDTTAMQSIIDAHGNCLHQLLQSELLSVAQSERLRYLLENGHHSRVWSILETLSIDATVNGINQTVFNDTLCKYLEFSKAREIQASSLDQTVKTLLVKASVLAKMKSQKGTISSDQEIIKALKKEFGVPLVREYMNHIKLLLQPRQIKQIDTQAVEENQIVDQSKKSLKHQKAIFNNYFLYGALPVNRPRSKSEADAGAGCEDCARDIPIEYSKSYDKNNN